jgi:crotonobetainyl-CoA:carnitine CoA-transferase CaiB-like acyl-CoA transferase
VNTSLYEAALTLMGFSVANYAADGNIGQRHGSGVALLSPHGAFEASDGFLVISCSNDRLFAKLGTALGNPEWGTDPKYATNMARLAHREEIERLITERLFTNTRAYWKDVLDKVGIACAPTQTVAEVYHHPQTQALGILGKPSEDELALIGVPLSFETRRPPPLASAGVLGRDNAELYSRLGLADVQGTAVNRD